MPRTSRLDAPGVLHHVMIRGIERKPIFADDKDKDALVDRLGKVLPETQTACYAWVFMDNHAHFLFRSPPAGISHVMRRLMTGYAGYFNRRHYRHGPVFQNRFKSILCQEDAYFKELVRYIHLNPLRAGLVEDLAGLSAHPYCGHNDLIGKNRHGWQDAKYVLAGFGKSLRTARKGYLAFVEAGMHMGKRDDLTGGGLIRSMGGWEAVKASFSSKENRQKSDQRILGDGDFVLAVLAEARENLTRKYSLMSRGVDRGDLKKRATELYKIDGDLILSRTRRTAVCAARSLYAYWAVAELGISRAELGRELGMTGPGVGLAVDRGRKITQENGYKMLD